MKDILELRVLCKYSIKQIYVNKWLEHSIWHNLPIFLDYILQLALNLYTHTHTYE